MSKEISQEQLYKVVSKLSLQNAVLWSNKIENHIESLKELIRLRQGTVSFNKFYDNDHKIGNMVVDKMNQLQGLLNQIYVRINDISQEELGFDFEIQKYSDLTEQVYEAYLVAKTKAEKTAKDEFKDRVDEVKARDGLKKA